MALRFPDNDSFHLLIFDKSLFSYLQASFNSNAMLTIRPVQLRGIPLHRNLIDCTGVCYNFQACLNHITNILIVVVIQCDSKE